VVLRLWREDSGLSLKSVADRAGCSHAYLYKLETGERAFQNTTDTSTKLQTLLPVSWHSHVNPAYEYFLWRLDAETLFATSMVVTTEYDSSEQGRSLLQETGHASVPWSTWLSQLLEDSYEVGWHVEEHKKYPGDLNGIPKAMAIDFLLQTTSGWSFHFEDPAKPRARVYLVSGTELGVDTVGAYVPWFGITSRE